MAIRIRLYRYRCHWSDSASLLGPPVKAMEGESFNAPFVYCRAANLNAAREMVAAFNATQTETSGPQSAHIPTATLAEYGFAVSFARVERGN